MDASFAAMVRKQLGDRDDLTPEQHKAIEARRKAAADMVHKLLNWESMEAMYLKVYRKPSRKQRSTECWSSTPLPPGRRSS